MATVQSAIQKVGPCGGGSSVPARDMDVTGITRIVTIAIRHGASIDALMVRYERNGRVESTDLWGGQGGRLTEINLEINEYITNVRGHIAPWGNTLQVRSLKIETNMNSYGPFGTQEGNPFELPAMGGGVIGLFARAGSMVEAIGVYVKTTVQSTANKVGPCGGGSGVTARDMDLTGVTRIVTVGIRHGASIDALMVRYERNGSVESTDLWGGQGGRLTEINLKQDEYITLVRGHIAPWSDTWQVRSLKLVTNLESYGPYGTEQGVPFELPAGVGRIIGFHARAGSMVEAIGVYVKDKMGNVWSSQEPIIKKIGPCGSGSGVTEKDMDITGVTRIVKISIRHGASIDAMFASYERNGKVESTNRWGGEGGRLTEINLQTNEFITNVRGHIAPWANTLQVRSLTVVTNLNTYGPYGTQEGVPFQLPAIGGRVIGFFARAGSMVEAIGVYVKAGESVDAGAPGQWTQSETSFWGRPVPGA
ncbi:hypothetical protein LUZ61_004656 [Rhynchospora tenuis]|uniref:Jacalin-type lectin domain-containing protein n=1 Tax=Rhynchospora tenuis TaxID=198213 RepID=A0AAD5ZN28_9POAL|nr:hypothetical protein LUZ61_004656 [Rhynchospora tenuis]